MNQKIIRLPQIAEKSRESASLRNMNQNGGLLTLSQSFEASMISIIPQRREKYQRNGQDLPLAARKAPSRIIH